MVGEDLKDWDSMCPVFGVPLGREFVENIVSVRFALRYEVLGDG